MGKSWCIVVSTRRKLGEGISPNRWKLHTNLKTLYGKNTKNSIRNITELKRIEFGDYDERRYLRRLLVKSFRSNSSTRQISKAKGKSTFRLPFSI